MLLAVMGTLFEETTTTGTVLPLAISLLATVVLFILGRLAFFLYRSGEVTVYGKRLADLDPRIVRLSLVMENHQKSDWILQGLFLAKPQEKEWIPLAKLTKDPILRTGEITCVSKRDGEFCFLLTAGGKMEVVVEFELTSDSEETYLLALDKSGRLVKAKINLRDNAAQALSFRKA